MPLEGNAAPLIYHFLIHDRALRGPSDMSSGDKVGSAQVQQLIVTDQKVESNWVCTNLGDCGKNTFALGKDAVFNTVQKMLLKHTQERQWSK